MQLREVASPRKFEATHKFSELASNLGGSLQGWNLLIAVIRVFAEQKPKIYILKE